MSQRTPSHWSAIATSVSTAAARSVGRERVRAARRRARRGSTGRGRWRAPGRRRARTSAGRARGRRRVPARSTPGASTVHGWSGATWFGHEVEDQPAARGRRAPRARRPGPAARRGARRRRSRGCSTASRRRRRARGRAGRARKLRHELVGSASAIAIPAGLRSHTPISQTASNAELGDRVPVGGRDGGEIDRRPVVRPRRSSHGQVLIS